MNLGSFLDHAARRHPEKIAVVCGNKRVTYAQLHERVQRLAAGLYCREVTRGTKVGIVSCNCIEYVEIVFALMKLGAVGVPINYRLGKQEIRALLEHAGVAELFVGRQAADTIAWDIPGIRSIITLDEPAGSDFTFYESLMRDPSTAGKSVIVTEQDPSFILYTAGTTGTPKGVVLTHGNQIWNTLNYAAAYSMVPDDREFAPTPLFHSSTLGRLFTYVFNQATVYLCERFDPEEALKLIQQEKITSLTQAPTMYGMMLAAAAHGAGETGSVRRAVTGAAPLMPGVKGQLQWLFPNAVFFDIYGLTEASPGVSILGPDAFFSKPASVGRPMLSVEVKVADDNGSKAPPGTVGEILCRGPNVMSGYYNNPAATDEVLNQGWLRTGDMGAVDDEGFLAVVGRKKELIISGGVNIYPGDVERVLLDHPAVGDAAVIGIADAVWGEKVVAAVVLRDRTGCSEEELTGFCRQHLAGFKCPREMLFVDALPRNAAQKVLKNGLKKVYKEYSRKTDER